MPEYPDIVVYIEHLRRRLLGQPLDRVRMASPFLLRTADPPIDELQGREAAGIERLGKRIVFDFGDRFFLVLHLMISGRLQWTDPGGKIPPKRGLAALDFPNGSLLITEASTQKRASLHVVRGSEALSDFDRGGLDVFKAGPEAFAAAVTAENHTLKRALTDPTILSGIGNAYSDEILHRAGLSPVKLSATLSEEEIGRLHEACRTVLTEWIDRLRGESGERFPAKVTAFRPEMAVHGKYGEACPICGGTVQRIRYAANETDYCPACQTGGRLLADRSLSRLLKGDWPRTPEELEALKRRRD